MEQKRPVDDCGSREIQEMRKLLLIVLMLLMAGSSLAYDQAVRWPTKTPMQVLTPSSGASTGDVVITHKDGKTTAYKTDSDTDAARGTALASAISASVAGDIIKLSKNTYSLSAPISIPDNVSLVGSDANGSVVTGNLNNTIIYVGNNTILKDVTVTNTSTGGASQCINIDAKTGVEIESVNMSGGVDVFSVAGGSARLHGVHWLDSAYDGGVITSGTIHIQDCTANLTPTDTGENSFLNVASGTVTVENCDIQLSRASNEGDLSYIRTSSGSPTIVSVGNRIKITGGTKNAFGFSEASFSSPTISSSYDYFTLTGATTYVINAPVGLGTYNVLGGNVTTINGSPTVNYQTSSHTKTTGATIGSLAGLLKAASGVVSAASGGTDYEYPLTFSYPLTRSTNTIGFGYDTTNLKITSNLLNTIQDISTTSDVKFNEVKALEGSGSIRIGLDTTNTYRMIEANGNLFLKGNSSNAGAITGYAAYVSTTNLSYNDSAGMILGSAGSTKANSIWGRISEQRTGGTTPYIQTSILAVADTDYSAPNYIYGRYWLICDGSDIGYSFNHGKQNNPTLFIHSANQSTTEWISFTHDQTNGVIDVGTGKLTTPDAFQAADFYSGDGTQGMTGTCSAFSSWTIKDGLVTACT